MQSYNKTGHKSIALTFDDGPNTTTTNAVLDILEQHEAVATFFLVGDHINTESAAVVKRAFAMGCEIANHSGTHSHMPDLSAEAMLEEVRFVDACVYQITGAHTKFFRPPYLAVNQLMYDTIAMSFIGGQGCNDFRDDVTTEERIQAVISGARDGQIVLLHDFEGNHQTVEALKVIVPALQAEGYRFVTLSELFELHGETPKRNFLYNTV